MTLHKQVPSLPPQTPKANFVPRPCETNNLFKDSSLFFFSSVRIVLPLSSGGGNLFILKANYLDKNCWELLRQLLFIFMHKNTSIECYYIVDFLTASQIKVSCDHDDVLSQAASCLCLSEDLICIHLLSQSAHVCFM